MVLKRRLIKAAAAKADSFMNAGYKNFMTEVNNLNKRMGDLRDTNGDAGAWARIMSGAGSADGGYSDNYTHVQVGLTKNMNWTVWTCLPVSR
ncbi:serine protease (autotransporter) [Escherichia coli]|nr:serine protease (autotransporter) [Escherichia coli]